MGTFKDATERHLSFMQALKDDVEAHIDIPPLELIAVLSQLVGNLAAVAKIEPDIVIITVLENLKQGTIETCLAEMGINDNENSN